jgi:hypothetical protein
LAYFKARAFPIPELAPMIITFFDISLKYYPIYNIW